MGIENQANFGEWLKQQRRLRGITQAELAKALSCSTINIRKIEADERKPSKQIASLLANFFHIPEPDQEPFVSFARNPTVSGAVNGFSEKTPQTEASAWPRSRNNSTLSSFPDPLPALPASRTSFIGRGQELTRLQNLMVEQGVRLLTLTGAPGVGKTRLAIEVGLKLRNEFSDGVCLIPLAPVHTLDEVIWTIAQILGVSGGSDKNHLGNLTAFLKERSCLLILDNFEQVLEAAPLIGEILKSCPNVKVLATSRESLHLYGEHEFQVSPLALPDLKTVVFSTGYSPAALLQFPSVQLFVQRCQAVLPDFQLKPDDCEAVANLCFRLDGLPLAIELAAARIKMYAPGSILEQLKNRFQFLSKGMRDFDIRHQTLSAAIDWSYQLLSPQEKLLFGRLGVISGYFTADSARAVCFLSDTSSEDSMASLQLDEEVLSSLVEKSLVQVSDAGKKFFVLETIREFALARLEERGELEILKTAHARYYLGLAQQARLHLHRPEASWWMDRLDENYINIRAAFFYAFDNGPLQEGLCAAASLLFYWYRRSTFSEGYLWLNTAIKHLDSGEILPLRAEVLTSFGAIGYFLRGEGISEEILKKALALWRELEDLPGEATALFWLSLVTREPQHTYLDESIALFRQAGDLWWLAFALWLQATLSVSSSGHPLALASLAESELLFRQIEDPYGLSYIHSAYGRVELAAGNMAVARDHMDKSLALKRTIGDKWGIAQELKDLGEVAFMTATQPEDFTRAKDLLEESIVRFRELNTQHIEILYAMHRLGNVLESQGDRLQALMLYQETLRFGQKYRTNVEWTAVFLVGPAHLALSGGNCLLAVQLMGAIYAFDPNYPKPIDQAGKIIMDNLLTTAQTCTTLVDYKLAWEQGQQLSVADAITLVFEMG